MAAHQLGAAGLSARVHDRSSASAVASTSAASVCVASSRTEPFGAFPSRRQPWTAPAARLGRRTAHPASSLSQRRPVKPCEAFNQSDGVRTLPADAEVRCYPPFGRPRRSMPSRVRDTTSVLSILRAARGKHCTTMSLAVILVPCTALASIKCSDFYWPTYSAQQPASWIRCACCLHFEVEPLLHFG